MRTQPFRRTIFSISIRVGAILTVVTATSLSCLARQEAKTTDGSAVRTLAPPPQAPFTGAWHPIGPQPTVPGAGNLAGSSGNTSGRVEAIAIDPTDATGNTVFIGAAQGGVWKTLDGGITWQPLTDFQASLAMGALAIEIDPTNTLDAKHRVIYAATGEQAGTGADIYYGAGVLKSLDGGQTWTQTCQGSALNNSSCPFVGPFSSGFIPGGGARISSLAVNPGNPKMLLAGVQIFTSSNISGQVGQPGVYCTGDGGGTWSRIKPTGLNTTAMASAVFYASSTTAFAAIGDYGGDTTNGIYVSQNANQTCSAQTWTRIAGTGLPSQSRFGRIEMSAAPSLVNGQILLYTAIADANTSSNTLLGVFRSADSGATWSQLNGIPDFCGSQCSYDLVVGVDPADATGNTVFFAGAGFSSAAGTTLLRSTDGGVTFGDFAKVGDGTFLHANQHAIEFTATGGKMYVANDGGVWSSTSAPNPAVAAGAQTWTDLDNGLAITQFNPGLSIYPSNASVAFGGTQGNGSQQLQALSGSNVWTDTKTCTNGGYTAVDANDPSSVYLACSGSSGTPQIYKSTTGGVAGTFSLLASSVTIGTQPNGTRDPLAVFPPMVADPNRPGHLYFGTYRLFETTNAAQTWNSVSGDLTSGGLANGISVTTIAIAPVASGAYNIFTGADDGTVEFAANVSPGGGPAFTNISGSLPGRSIAKIIADSSDATGKTAYVVFSGFSIDTSISGSPTDLKGHLFKTTDGGANWSDVGCHTADCAAPLGTDLPNTPINDLLLDPDDSAHATLYVATDIGMFVTVNDGATWAQMGTALPNVAVFSLALHEPSRTLRAATHGRSAWDYSLPALSGTTAFALSSISPVSAQAGDTALTLTLNGRGFTPNSTVKWNNSANGVSGVQVNLATQTITAQIAATLIAQPGTAAIAVSDSTATPNTTNALPLTVFGSAPALNSLQPSTLNAGAADTMITITGSNFNQNAQVTFNNSSTGVTLGAVNAGGTQITATLSHSLLVSGGQFFIGVTNPPPGGGVASPQLTLQINSAAHPANDNFANAIAVTSAISTSSVDNSSATSEAADPIPPCAAGLSQNPTGKSVWWRYTPGSGGTLVVTTVGSSYDTLLSVYSGSAGNLTNVACNNNISSTVLQSQVQIAVTLGTTYFFMVSAFDASQCPPAGTNPAECGGNTVINFNGPIPAGLTASPSTMSVNIGGSAAFTINTLSPPLSGQVSFTVAGCPPVSTCLFTPNSTTAGGAVSLSVATTAGGTASPAKNLGRAGRFLQPQTLVWSALLAFMAFTFIRLSHSLRRRKGIAISMATLFAAVLLTCDGCGVTGPVTGPPVGTPSGAYSLVVTATGNGNVTATTTVNLTVN